jgi:hypothetical protein
MEGTLENIAFDFSMILFEWLGKNNFQEMVEKSIAETDTSICHSHDYCDANVAMIKAMETNGFPFIVDHVNEEYYSMSNRAWDVAKSNHFFIETLISNDQHEFKY